MISCRVLASPVVHSVRARTELGLVLARRTAYAAVAVAIYGDHSAIGQLGAEPPRYTCGITATDFLQPDAVREVLHALRYSQPLEESPLLSLAMVTEMLEREGMPYTPGSRIWCVGALISAAVTAELQRHRGVSHAQWGVTEAQQLAELEADLSSGDPQRQAWGALHYRYLTDVEQPVQRAQKKGISQSTLYRRVQRGTALLAELLDERERRTSGSDSPDELDVGEASFPVPTTTLLGREGALATVSDFLRRTRLLTLKGPGGAGKTRLAIAAAMQAAGRFRDGATFIDLSALSDDDGVAGAVTSALGAREAPGATFVETLIAALADQERLIVLDNCEHVLMGAAEVAEVILAGARGVTILATSREPLRAAGEQVWGVPPLTLPAIDADDAIEPAIAMRSDAVQLYVQRATEADPAFRLELSNASAVAQLCVALDGLPLAIELSASMIGRLSPRQQVAARDRLVSLLKGGPLSAPARHQTLQSTLNWSYELLSDGERRLFARLAVFRGGWTLAAAESICAGGGVAEWDVLGLMGQLIDKSLVTAAFSGGRMRYGFLDTMRGYAVERFDATDDKEQVRQAHLEHYVTMAQQSLREGRESSALSGWIRRLDAEHDNCRVALAYAKAIGDGRSAAMLGGGLGWSFYVRGQVIEGRRFLEQVLGVPGASDASDTHMRVLSDLGTLASAHGDYEEARRFLEAALEIADALGDARVAGGLHNDLGVEALLRGDNDAAELHLRESLKLAGERPGVRGNLGLVALGRGDYTTAREHLQASIALARAENVEWFVGHSEINLGEVEYRVGNLEGAKELFEAGLASKDKVKDRSGTAFAHLGLGVIAIVQERPAEARRRLIEAARIAIDTGDQSMMAKIVAGIARFAASAGELKLSSRLLEAADGATASLGAELTAAEQAELDDLSMSLREMLGTASYEAARAGGKDLDLETAIDEALQFVRS